MLGFPIRTPPDHSSVANSPGLIAGSYVLHRLLMPRHPPCALHSLSHKHSTKTTTTKTNPAANPPPNKQGGATSRVDKRDHPMVRGDRADARVHYPVHKMPAHQAGRPESGTPPRRPSKDPADPRTPRAHAQEARGRLIPQSSTVCPDPAPRRPPQVPRPDPPPPPPNEERATDRVRTEEQTTRPPGRPTSVSTVPTRARSRRRPPEGPSRAALSSQG